MAIPTPQLVIVPEIEESWSIVDIATKSPPLGWEHIFQSAIPEFEEIDRILAEQQETFGPCYPRRKDVFQAFELTRLHEVKVVIFGQDPYHSVYNGRPQATGLSFSVPPNSIIPPSLKNIFKELADEYPRDDDDPSKYCFVLPSHGDLRGWARQGVLLLNTCLTVNPGQAGSHGDIWKGFIVRVIRAINEANPNCIYVMWGKKAQSLGDHVGGRSVPLISPHPSPFSAHGRNGREGFFGNGHFVKINELLIEQGKQPIDWNL